MTSKITSISVLFGLMMVSALVSADADTVTITYPTNGTITETSVLLNATTTVNAVCEYTVGGGWTAMDSTGGMVHTHFITGLSTGENKVHVHCCEGISNRGCGQAMNDQVKWTVKNDNPPAIPEYPTSAIPVILSMLSFGIVRMKL